MNDDNIMKMAICNWGQYIQPIIVFVYFRDTENKVPKLFQELAT